MMMFIILSRLFGVIFGFMCEVAVSRLYFLMFIMESIKFSLSHIVPHIWRFEVFVSWRSRLCPCNHSCMHSLKLSMWFYRKNLIEEVVIHFFDEFNVAILRYVVFLKKLLEYHWKLVELKSKKFPLALIEVDFS